MVGRRSFPFGMAEPGSCYGNVFFLEGRGWLFLTPEKITETKKKTPCALQGNIRPVAEEVADIARRLQRAKHSVQQISEITGLDPTVVESLTRVELKTFAVGW